jgi:hypothetical protein
MLFIVVELNGFRQLMKVNSTLVKQIQEYIESTISNDSCFSVDQKRSIFIYSCPCSDQDYSSVLINAINLFYYLESINENLVGYNILIDQHNGEYTEDFSRHLLIKMYSLKNDKALYISSNNYTYYKDSAEWEADGKFYKLISYTEQKLDDCQDIINFLSGRKEIDFYLESMTPLINNDKNGLIYFYGEEPPGISILSFCIAKLLQGKTNDVPWIYLMPDGSKISNFHPLIKCMNINLVRTADKYLSESELAVWNIHKHFIEEPDSIIFDEDAIILFRIYLKAYSKKMIELLLPSTIFILDVHNFNEITLKYIADILEDLYVELSLVPIFFSGEETLPASINGFQGKKIAAEEWNLYEKSESEQNISDPGMEINSPVSFYHSWILKDKDKGLFNGIDITDNILKELGHSSKHYLIIYSLFYNLCSKEALSDYLSVDGSDKLRNEKIIRDLVLNGFIYPDENGEPVFKDISRILAYKFTQEDELLIDRIVEDLRSKTNGTQLFVLEKIADIYRKLELFTKEAFYILDVIDLLIKTGKPEIASLFFERLSELLRKKMENKNTIEIRQNIYLLRVAIYDNKDDFATEVYLRLCNMETANPILDAERWLVCSEYSFALYQYKNGLDSAKLALLGIQDTDNSYIKTSVNLHLARVLMGMKRIDESKDYFKIAKETYNSDKDSYSILEINTHEAVVNFIAGNFSNSLRLVNQGFIACNKTDRRDWELFLLFMQGRILFEMGSYLKAQVLLSNALGHCDIYFNGEKKEIFNIWLGRCYIYLNEIRYGLKILIDYQNYPEALYFAAEGLYFQNEYNNAFEKIELAFNTERDRNRFFCSSNIISWESGYDFMEDRGLVVEGGHGVLFQLIRAFRAFLLAKTGEEIEGRAELVRLTREERLDNIDPNNGYYYYLHALTFPEYSGAESVDRVTLLSKALRYIQQTASNIDVPRDRQLYLTANYWNFQLMEEGRTHKLI